MAKMNAIFLNGPQAGNGSKDVTRFSSPLEWMEAKDQCDPDSLKQDSVVSYMQKILLHADHTISLELWHLKQTDISSQTKETKAIKEWQKPLLCRYTLDRLFSFSIFTARVFGRGDPAHHADSSAGQCLQIGHLSRSIHW
uniref:Uncharacterized protein n=1 Tax=Myripristis murdjan TaxID=586833 RepID=A0A667YUZ2_9TELE